MTAGVMENHTKRRLTNPGLLRSIGKVHHARIDQAGFTFWYPPIAEEPRGSHSWRFWQREFGGDPGVLARTISLNGYSVPIIGVTPPTFFGVEVGNRYDLSIPLCADPLLAEDKKGRIPVGHAW